jgi:acetyltransferase
MMLPRPRPAGRFVPDMLFRPASVGVLGVGTPAGTQVLDNLRAGGFARPVLTAADAAGIAAWPAAPDLAVLADDGDASPLLAALAARGTLAAVAVGMARGLDDPARRGPVRVLGPGSFGVAVPAIGLNASRAHLPPRAGRLALVSQSAALCRAVLDWAEPNGVGFSHIVGVGGNADLGFGAVLDWLARDPGTGAILLDLRRVKDARAFLSAARAAGRLRPVVAIRAGGRLIDATGEADRVLVAALRRAGVLSVSRLEDLLAAAETLSRARPARAGGLAIVTNAIGLGRMAADAALADGLDLAALTPPTREVLRRSLPVLQSDAVPGAPPTADDGPVYVGIDHPARLAEVAAMLAGAAEVGGVLAVHAPTGAADAASMDALVACARGVRVPLLVCAAGETTGAPHRRRLAEAGLPVFATPEQAVRGFHHLAQDRRNRAAARELPPSAVLELAPDRAAVERVCARARAAGRLDLVRDEAMAVCAAYGIALLPARAAASPEAAAEAATVLGFPVALRSVSGTSTETVADVFDAQDVLLAARAMVARVARATGQPPALLVQRQPVRAPAWRVRVSEDALFGPVIGVGPAGAPNGALALDLPPLNLPLAHALAGADQDAVAETLVRISQLVVDFADIAALTLDPLYVEAGGACVGDATMRLHADPHARRRLAISPYPAELVERVTLGGETLTVRPIRPEDAERHGAFFRSLSPEDIRYRFFSAMRELSAEQMARMTQVDYDREMAFVAVRAAPGGDDPGGEETLGVARLVIEPGGRSGGEEGEFAIIVRPDMKGRGLATHLMRRLIDWARSRGVREIVGQVLADNAPMLAFVRHLGFRIARLPGEEDVVEARLTLAP